MRAVAQHLSDFLERVELRSQRLVQLAHLGSPPCHYRVDLRALGGGQVELFGHPVEPRPWAVTIVPVVREIAINRDPDCDSSDQRTDQEQQGVALGALHFSVC